MYSKLSQSDLTLIRLIATGDNGLLQRATAVRGFVKVLQAMEFPAHEDHNGIWDSLFKYLKPEDAKEILSKIPCVEITGGETINGERIPLSAVWCKG